MTTKVGTRIICDNCYDEEFVPHADAADAEISKAKRGDWEMEEENHIRKHYCPECGENTMTDDVNPEKIADMLKAQFPVDHLELEKLVELVIKEYERERGNEQCLH